MGRSTQSCKGMKDGLHLWIGIVQSGEMLLSKEVRIARPAHDIDGVQHSGATARSRAPMQLRRNSSIHTRLLMPFTPRKRGYARAPGRTSHGRFAGRTIAGAFPAQANSLSLPGRPPGERKSPALFKVVSGRRTKGPEAMCFQCPRVRRLYVPGGFKGRSQPGRSPKNAPSVR
jgi:hypothetical protein